MCSSVVFAQDYSEQIIDLDNNGVRQESSQLADLVVLAEQLAQEVRELRGLVDQQGYDLRKLQQQRLDDYRSLDQRIAELGELNRSVTAGRQDVGMSTATIAVKESPLDNTVIEAPKLSEKEAYRAAYAYVKSRDFEAAVGSFKTFLEQYPDGSYAGNAYYWLGELYVLDNGYTEAQQSMQALIAQFPEHRKVPDAHYKLAKIFHKLDDALNAQKHANIVIDNYAKQAETTVKLAQKFLATNYPQ